MEIQRAIHEPGVMVVQGEAAKTELLVEIWSLSIEEVRDLPGKTRF